MKLYDYWRSSAAYRVRIGLCLKGIEYDHVIINIAPGADEQLRPVYRSINSQARVPALETNAGLLTQSLAILEWLEETYPLPSFFSGSVWSRAQIRAFALTISCDIHPLNNLAVQKRLRSDFNASDQAIAAWGLHWIRAGFMALEAQLAERPQSPFVFGDAPTLADICLAPQCYNARRLNLDFSPFPRIAAIDANCRAHPAFIEASPDNHARRRMQT